MENNRPDHIKFLINSVSLVLIIIAIIHTYQPYFENEVHIDEIHQVEQQFTYLEPAEVPRYLTSSTGKPVMLVSYASWCYYCRQVMPMVVAELRDHQLDGVAPVFISMDNQPRRLSQYLVHNNYNNLFSPYIVDHGLASELSDAMMPSGSSFSGVIPYIGFFDTHGKIKAESVGVIDKSRFLSMYRKVAKN